MSDELPTAARVSDPGIRALYRLENRWQAWLDVEAALAKAQQELGIIPKGAAEATVRASTKGSPAPAIRSCRWFGN
jgi:3-carboxy-cis,cis-muconate cycloisomerase